MGDYDGSTDRPINSRIDLYNRLRHYTGRGETQYSPPDQENDPPRSYLLIGILAATTIIGACLFDPKIYEGVLNLLAN
jgi:hypothetical protein